MKTRTLSAVALALFAATQGLQAQQAPSSLVQPALDKLAQAGSNVDLNKWKGGNGLRGEVDANLASIQKDLRDTLPPLLIAADKSPTSAAATMPVLLNLDALYSVVLRIDIAAKANAPRNEADNLDGALAALDGARRDLGDRMVASAQATEKQLAELQATIQQQATQIQSLQQAATATPPSKITKKRVAKKKTTTAPAPAGK